MEAARRRKLAAVTLFLIVERERKKQNNKKIWARYWLQRRNTICNTLTMLNKELRFVIYIIYIYKMI